MYAEKQKEIKVLHDGIRILSRVIESETDFEKYSFLKQFSHGLKLLDDYDHDLLDRFGKNKNEIKFPEYSAYLALINNMRLKSNSSIFGVEKDGGFKSAIAQVRQEFESGEIYTSLEEKAAMLLYFIVYCILLYFIVLYCSIALYIVLYCILYCIVY